MGIYAKYLLPRIIDLAMRNDDSRRLRAEWIPMASGRVLEIGIGSGLNLPFYSHQVSEVLGVDPSRELERLARKRVRASSFPVEFLAKAADERLPLEDQAFDTVVVTWSLCSIPNPARALEEARRVLKAGGKLIFLEHGLAPEERVRTWQERLTPWSKRLAGGCHLNRKIDDLIGSAGFDIHELRTGYLRGPRPMTYSYQGVATRPH
jgi:ubiquinone/menaquinone biosynthesis C-methylase UbiE